VKDDGIGDKELLVAGSNKRENMWKNMICARRQGIG